MKTEAIMSVMISPHEIKTANVSLINSPFCRVTKDANSHLVLKIFQVYIQHFNPLNAKLNPICHLLALLGAHHILHVGGLRVNSEKGRLETKLLMFRENLMKQHKLLHNTFMGH